MSGRRGKKQREEVKDIYPIVKKKKRGEVQRSLFYIVNWAEWKRGKGEKRRGKEGEVC